MVFYIGIYYNDIVNQMILSLEFYNYYSMNIKYNKTLILLSIY